MESLLNYKLNYYKTLCLVDLFSIHASMGSISELKQSIVLCPLKNAVAGNAYSCRSTDKSALIQQSAMHALISFISRLVHSAISRISSSGYPIFNIFSITRCLLSLWPSALPSFLPISLSSAAEYYGAAEPPVRCGESHLSGLTEPPQFVY